MFDFIYLLRIVAAILITNSHYEAIYPISAIANGGLLGDVLFFAISGFCLFPVKRAFPTWYRRRLKRIYPVVWIITLIYLLLGFYQAHTVTGFVKLLLYPTNYHFVASILLLYIVFYFAARFLQAHDERFNRRFVGFAVAVVLAYVLIYSTIYDRSFYHIDTVREPMIEFLYFSAMLTGLWFRNHREAFLGKASALAWLVSVILFMGYIASKLAFSSGRLNSGLQWINQVILLLLLICLFRGFIGLEEKLHRMPEKLHRAMVFVAGFAFEIYLVQYALIPRLNIGPFPVNFLLVSGTIFVSALALHKLHDWIMAGINRMIVKFSK